MPSLSSSPSSLVESFTSPDRRSKSTSCPLICLSHACVHLNNSEDKDKLRIPKNFDDLKTLNTLLKKYRNIYPYRILISFICVYL